MIALLCFFLTLFASPFKPKTQLEAENAALRHQLIILRRKVRGHVRLTNGDRLFLVLLYRWFPSVLSAITIIRPETLVRWHRAGFRQYWRWKSRSLGGRPQIDADLRALIWRMSLDNPLWGAPRIHGELLKLGFDVSRSSVAAVLTAMPFGRTSLFRAVKGKTLPDWAKDFDAGTWGQFFLKFLLGNKQVTAVIPGTGNADHMIDNLGAARGRLPGAQQRERMAVLLAS
jgi:hypothetical protein